MTPRRRWRVEVIDTEGRPLPWAKHRSERAVYDSIVRLRRDPGLRGWQAKVWVSDDSGESWQLYEIVRFEREAS